MAAMTSLAILNPTPTPLADKTFRKSSTARYLEHKTRQVVEYIDQKDFANPEIAELLVPEFSAYFPHTPDPYARNLTGWLEQYRAFTTANPHYFCEIVSISANVNEKNGTGTVWMLLRVTGHPSTLQRENVTIVHWKRKQGRWRAYKQTGMRGFGGL